MISFLSKYFLTINNQNGELKKLALLRIFGGLIILARVSQILITSPYFNTQPGAFPVGVLFISLTFCFTLGFLSNLTTPLAILSFVQMDGLYGTSTLGTSIAIQFMTLLFFCKHSTFYSLDALIIKRADRLSPFFRKVHSIMPEPSSSSLQLYYLFAFFCYALISLAVIIFHLLDPNWIVGDTTGIILTSSFLSKYYMAFRKFQEEFSAFYSFLSSFSIIGQSIFQVFMIPLVFTKLGRLFVFWWGIVFFLTCFFLFNLSYLPHIEILFWVAIFVRPFGKEESRISYQNLNLYSESRNKKWHKQVVTIFYSGLFFFFIFFKFPFISSFTDKQIRQVDNLWARNILVFAQNHINAWLYRLGFSVPVVFNSTDLLMTETWFVLYRIEDSKRILIPIFDEFGGRLNYFFSKDYFQFGNHGSDIIYFSGTGLYKRMLINNNIVNFHSKGNFGYDFIKSIMRIDYLKNQFEVDIVYYYEVRNDNSVKEYSTAYAIYRFKYKVIVYDTIIINKIDAEKLYQF